MNYKKLLSRALTLAMAFMMVGSVYVEVVKAGNTTDTKFEFLFLVSSGYNEQYSGHRPKEDATSGWVRSDATSQNTFRAALVGYNNGNFVENFGGYGGLRWVTAAPGYGYYLPNYVYEYGLEEAALKGEGIHEETYEVTGMWSPDSI